MKKALLIALFVINVFTVSHSSASGSKSAPIESFHSPLKISRDNKILGVKCSFTDPDQVSPISSDTPTELQIEKLLHNTKALIDSNTTANYDYTSESIKARGYFINTDPEALYRWKEDDTTAAHPFSAFGICGCIDIACYKKFSTQVVDKLAELYLRKDPKKPFVYGSFASGGLFPDVYILTELVQKLKVKNVKDINIQINLFDTDLKNFITEVASGLGRSAGLARPSGLERSPLAKMGTSKTIQSHLSTTMTFGRILTVPDLITYFLSWLTKNLGITCDLYIYASAHDYIYDYSRNRMPALDALIAMDFYETSDGDLAQLALRAIKLNGYLCTLSNRSDDENDTSEHAALPDNVTYSELAEIARNETELKKAAEAAELEKAMQAYQMEQSDNDATQSDDNSDDDVNEDYVSIMISQKIKDFSAEQLKELLKKSRGNYSPLGNLIIPLLDYQLDKNNKHRYKRYQQQFKFNPLDYFSIKFSEKCISTFGLFLR